MIRSLVFAGAATLMATITAPAAAQPAPPAAAAVLSTHDMITAAAQTDEYERRAGRLAETMGHSPRVRAFGAMMVRDHTMTTRNLKAAIRKSGRPVPPPPPLSPDQQSMLAQLKSAGPDFDFTYLQQQVQVHQMALHAMDAYARHGDDPVIRGAIRDTLPIVRRHLTAAQNLQGSVRK